MKPCVTPNKCPEAVSTVHRKTVTGSNSQTPVIAFAPVHRAASVCNHLERNPHLVYKEHLLLGFLMCLLKLVILIAAIGRFHARIVFLHASAENRLCRRRCGYLGKP